MPWATAMKTANGNIIENNCGRASPVIFNTAIRLARLSIIKSTDDRLWVSKAKTAIIDAVINNGCQVCRKKYD